MGLDVNKMMNVMLQSDFKSDGVWEDEVKKATDEDFVIPQPDEAGNYQTPALKILKEQWDGFFKGTLDAATLQETIEGVYVAIEEQQDMMEEGVEEFDDSPENPINQDVFEAFEMHKESLELMQKFFETNDKLQVEKSLKILQEATNLLMKAFVRFIDSVKAELRILCPGCGAENIKGNEKCVKCGLQLPLLIPETIDEPDLIAAEEGEDEEVLTTDNYDQVSDAIESWRAGEMDDSELLLEISEVEGRFLAHKKALLGEMSDVDKLEGEAKKVWMDLSNLIEDALNQNLKAIANMKEYFNDQNPVHIDRGFDEFWDATRAIIKSYNASEEMQRLVRQAMEKAKEE